MIQKSVEISRLLKGFFFFNLLILPTFILLDRFLFGNPIPTISRLLIMLYNYKILVLTLILFQIFTLIIILGFAKTLALVFYKNKLRDQGIPWGAILGAWAIGSIFLYIILIIMMGVSHLDKNDLFILIRWDLFFLLYILLLHILGFKWKKNNDKI